MDEVYLRHVYVTLIDTVHDWCQGPYIIHGLFTIYKNDGNVHFMISQRVR